MARSVPTSSTPSVPRRSKQSSTIPAGTTPRPPRRRKQPTTKTPAAAQRRSSPEEDLADFSSSPDEYAFSSSAAAPSDNDVCAKSGKGKNAGLTVLKSSRQGSSSRNETKVAGEKENATNESSSRGDRKERKATKVVNADREQRGTNSSVKKSAKKVSRKRDPMEDLNESMAKVDLGTIGDRNATKICLEKDAKCSVNPFPPIGFGTKSISLSTGKDGKSKYILRSAIQKVEKCGENESVSKLFQAVSMVDAVASASFSLGPTESMLLEENTSKLIDTAKRCLKSLSSSTSSSKKADSSTSNNARDDSETALLRVAVYSLRSILPTLIESEKSQSTFQMVIKLFYHCVVIAGDACHRKFQLFTNAPSSTSPSFSKKYGLRVMDYAMICLGAYEGLGRCLQVENEPLKSERTTVSWDGMLPILGLEGTTSQVKSTSKVLPHRQYVKIAMESALCASSSFFYLSLISLHLKARNNNEKWTVPHEFLFVSSVVSETCSGQYKENPTFQKLISNAFVPYVIQSLLTAEEGDNSSSFNVDALRHVRKAFRILWDGARCVEGVCDVNNAPALRMSCLDLQSEAILFILQTLRELFELCPNLMREVTASGAKELYALFDRASSSAMKAAGMFKKATRTVTSSAAKATSTDDPSMCVKKLLHFHSIIGHELDEMAVHLCPQNSSIEERRRQLLPASYYEYSVYRSIHRWQLLGSVETKYGPPFLSFDKRTKQVSSEEMVALSTFSIVQMALLAQHGFKTDAFPLEISDTDCEHALSNFEHMVISNSPPSTQSRSRSMLMLLDLQRGASKVMVSIQSGDKSYSDKGAYIAVLASVIGRCLAPLDTQLARATKEQSRSLNFRLSAADNHAKSATLFDLALENSPFMTDKLREKFTIEADLQLNKSYKILMTELDRLEKSCVDRKASPVSAIEMFAKAATFVGRRRFDRKEIWSSIQPQILASEILSKVAIRASEKGLFNTYQIPTRFVHLSSALDANGSMGESCAALAMAAWCSIENMASSSAKPTSDMDEVEGDSTSEKILLFPESEILDMRPQDTYATNGLSPIINRLTRAYIECRNPSKEESSQDNCAEPTGESLSRILKNTLVGKVFDVACPSTSDDESSTTDKLVGKVLLSKLLHCIVWNKKRYEGDLSMAQIADIVREILKSTIKVMKGHLAEKLLSHVFEELRIFLQAQKKRLGEFLDPDLLQVLSSSFHVSFAARLVDSRLLHFPRPSSWVLCKSIVKKQECQLLQYSCTQLQLAEKQFAAAFTDEHSVHDVIFFAQWAAVQLHHAILLEHLSLAKLSQDSVAKQICLVGMRYTSALSTGSRAIEQLSETNEEVHTEVVESVLSTLQRLLCWFSCHSDSISATRCFILLQKAYSLPTQPQHLVGAVSSFLSISSKFEDLATTFMSYSMFHDHSDSKLSLGSDSNSQLNFVPQCVVDSVNLTLQIIGKPTVRRASTLKLERLMCQIFESVQADMEMLSGNSDEEEINSDMCSKTHLMIQKQLVVTTILMLHAKLCLDSGQPASAAKYLGWCRIQCKQIVRFLRFANCHLNHDDIALQLDDMVTVCLERLSAAFYLLGIRRKAADYALVAVVKQKTLTTDCQTAQTKIQDLIDLIEKYDGHECFLQPIRSLLKIKALSTSADKIASQQILIENVGCRLNIDLHDRTACTNRIISKSKNVLAYDDYLHHVPCFRAKAHLYIDQVYKELNHCVMEDTYATISPSMLVPMSSFSRRVGIELKLRIFRDPGSGLFSPAPVDKSTAAMLKQITDEHYGSGICNAEAYYRLGLIALSKARNSRALQGLWKEHAIVPLNEECCNTDFDDCSSILEARTFFGNALTNAPPASFILTKNILRCLALVTGPEEGQPEPGLISASLIHISVGGSARNIVRDALDAGKVLDSFKVFDDESLDHNASIEAVCLFLKDSANLIPIHWHISTMATCPTGEVLISSLRVSVSNCREKITEISTACIFPASRPIPKDDSKIGIHADVLIPLDQIIERSQKQLHGMNEEVQNEQYNEESSRRKWWNERHSIDEDLQSLLEYAERTYFGQDPVRQRIIPHELFANETRHDLFADDDSSECSDFGPGNLASRFEAAEREPSKSIVGHQYFDRDTEKTNLKKLTVAVIKSKLAFFGVADKDVKRIRKAELIDILLSEMENSCNIESEEETTSISEENEHSATIKNTLYSQEYPHELENPCTILILDEHLLRFPFESMNMLSNITVTRVPSLPFVLATLLETESLHSIVTPKVDARKVKYVLDPESNLSESASTLGPALNSIASKNGWEWEQVVGQMPSSSFMSQALLEENGLYLYCGHGGGEKAFSRSQVEELMAGRNDGIRGCRASIVLMGCSSGKLQSVNTPKENPSGCVHSMHYEPEGIALSYLFAGAPCVVGNLWDVTDRDIDRYCLTLMEDFVQCQDGNTDLKSSISLAKCVANARRACKLRFIVGSAPVCYGVPVACSPF